MVVTIVAVDDVVIMVDDHVVVLFNAVVAADKPIEAPTITL